MSFRLLYTFACWIGAGFLVMIAIPSITEAQSDLKLWFKPSMGDLKPIPFYKAGYFAEESIRHQAADMEFTRHNAGLIYPAWQNAENEWTLNTSIDYIDFDTRAIFPDSGRRFPDDLTHLCNLGRHTGGFSTMIGSEEETSNSVRPAPNFLIVGMRWKHERLDFYESPARMITPGSCFFIIPTTANI